MVKVSNTKLTILEVDKQIIIKAFLFMAWRFSSDFGTVGRVNHIDRSYRSYFLLCRHRSSHRIGFVSCCDRLIDYGNGYHFGSSFIFTTRFDASLSWAGIEDCYLQGKFSVVDSAQYSSYCKA